MVTMGHVDIPHTSYLLKQGVAPRAGTLYDLFLQQHLLGPKCGPVLLEYLQMLYTLQACKLHVQRNTRIPEVQHILQGKSSCNLSCQRRMHTICSTEKLLDVFHARPFLSRECPQYISAPLLLNISIKRPRFQGENRRELRF